MSLTVILALGLDSSPATFENPAWESAGYFLTIAASIKDAIVQLRDGDFDLVLLGKSISEEDKERLLFVLRRFGLRIPVLCLRESSSVVLPDSASQRHSNHIVRSIEKFLQEPAAVSSPHGAVRSHTIRKSASND